MTGLVRSTATRRRNAATALTPAVCTEPAVEPANKLTDAERRRVVEVLTSDRFVDLAPLQIYAQLLDEGVYLCSVSTMYRVLGQHTLVAERRRLARHPSQVCPELVATAPQQVYSWDITKLAGPVRGTYFDAYVMIDIYSQHLFDLEPLADGARTLKVTATPDDGSPVELRDARSHRHAERVALLPPRRHPALRAAPAAQEMSTSCR